MSPPHLPTGTAKCRPLYSDLTEILSCARAGMTEPIGGTSVDKSTLLCGVVESECVVSSSAGDILLSVDSLGGVVGPTTAEEGEESPARENRNINLEDLAIFGEPAVVCRAHALSIAERRQRFNSLFVVPSRLPLVW